MLLSSLRTKQSNIDAMYKCDYERWIKTNREETVLAICEHIVKLVGLSKTKHRYVTHRVTSKDLNSDLLHSR